MRPLKKSSTFTVRRPLAPSTTNSAPSAITVAARQQLGVVLQLPEQRDRFLHGARGVVIERGCVHRDRLLFVGGRDGLPDLRRREWHVEVRDAKGSERVEHGTGHRRGRRDGAGLASALDAQRVDGARRRDRKSTRLNSSHGYISYAVFCLKKKNK